ncbi:MAG TPA: sensor histidine kinase [Dongiaceae bacterium]|jgi:signal transduction histidine kinase|nr:sensor histidine kinase [Dongiaceae bacterium]
MTAELKRFEPWSKPFLAAFCIELVIAIGFLDYVTGYEISFFIIYLIPVLLAVWRVGVPFAVVISLLSMMTWLGSNITAGWHFSNWIVPVWNSMIVTIFYLVVVRLFTLHRELEARVRQRTAALTQEMQERRRLEKELLEASEREQRRIGHDLHDSLCQHLTGTALAGQVLGKKLADKSLPEAAAANHLVELIEEGIELTRTLARGLHPVAMNAVQLADNFQELAVNTSERFNVSCKFECPQPVQLHDPSVITHLYRIAQEAISNAIRHGKARHVNICLDSADNETVLTVTDDGAGLPQIAQNNQGMGLRIMAYRASMIGGAFNIERLSMRGTRATCTLPAATEAHAAKK